MDKVSEVFLLGSGALWSGFIGVVMLAIATGLARYWYVVRYQLVDDYKEARKTAVTWGFNAGLTSFIVLIVICVAGVNYSLLDYAKSLSK